MKGILYAVAVALLFISLASAQDYVYIVASNSNPVQLSPDQSNTTYIFKKNFTFTDIVIDNKTIAFNTTTNYPTTLMIEGTGPLNVTIHNLIVNKYYAFTLQSNTNPSPVSFLIQTHIRNQKFIIYVDGEKYGTAYSNTTGWISYVYDGSFSEHTISFSLPSVTPPTKTPTPPPFIPPIPLEENSLWDNLLNILKPQYLLIIFLLVAIAIALIKR